MSKTTENSLKSRKGNNMLSQQKATRRGYFVPKFLKLLKKILFNVIQFDSLLHFHRLQLNFNINKSCMMFFDSENVSDTSKKSPKVVLADSTV